MSTPWPDLATLELLVATGRTGSLSAAARELGLAQPNASRSISRLERRLGMQLVTRSRNGSELTTPGRMLAEWARPVLVQAESWREGTNALDTEVPPQFEFAASLSCAEQLAPHWLARLREQVPELVVRMHVVHSPNALAMVTTQEVELAFVEVDQEPEGFHCTTVDVGRLALVVSPAHEWAQRSDEPVTLAELASAELFMREQESGPREAVDTALGGLQRVGHYRVHTSNSSLAEAALNGEGAALLAEQSTLPYLALGKLVRVPLADPDLFTRRVVAVWTARPLGAAAQALLDLTLADRRRREA